MLKRYQDKIFARAEDNSLRKLSKLVPKVNLDFSSNDYLGLSQNKKIIQAAQRAMNKYGIGSTGSRLLSGNNILFNRFEKEIAYSKNTDRALIFNSGYQCNLSVLSVLLDIKVLKSEALVFFDKLNHASLYQAIFLSKAILIRYKHNDHRHLDSLISAYQFDTRPKFIVTETVFGMDGDIAPLEEIIKIARKHDALLYLDEAHATGVLGKNGYGLSTTLNFHGVNKVIMGTFSKAIGVSGAYIACDEIIAQYLINFCSGFIYSTANSPALIAGAYAAWRLLPKLDHKRYQLLENSSYLVQSLKDIGFNVPNSSTNIVPVILHSNAKAKYIHDQLLLHGIKVSCILPPTVPLGTARIRIALTVHHTRGHINQFIYALSCIINRLQ